MLQNHAQKIIFLHNIYKNYVGGYFLLYRKHYETMSLATQSENIFYFRKKNQFFMEHLSAPLHNFKLFRRGELEFSIMWQSKFCFEL